MSPRFPLLLILLWTSGFFPVHPVTGAEVEKKAVAATPADLLKIWKDYGLPMPPAEARLVKFSTGSRGSKKGGKMMDFYSLGFLVESGSKDRKPVILAGHIRHQAEQSPDGVVKEIEPVPAALKEEFFTTELGMTDSDTLLGTAVQCEARGWSEFAREVLALSLSQGAGHPRSALHRPAGMNAADALYMAIWSYLQTEAMQPGCDRASLAAKMKRLLDAGHNLPRNGGRWLYDALNAAAQPGKGKPGTPEGIIDRLVDSRKGGGTIRGPDRPDAEDPYYQIEAMGFAAVPALLEHIDDPRLTCSMTQGFNNFPDWPRRVGDLVSDLLQDLSGSELEAGWLDRQKGGGVAREAARDWWKKARAMGEEAWLVKGAMATTDSERSFPNACHLRILQVRFPQRLPEVLRTQMKELPKAQIHPVITALVESKLPDLEKTTVLKECAAHQNPETKRVALMALSKYDLPFFNAEAIKAFDAMAKEPRGAYWTSPEAGLSHLALRTDDAAVWAAFLRSAQRAETGLRMELMNPLNYTCVGEDFKERRLAFLAAFLNDTTLRVLPARTDSGKYEGPCAAFTIPRLRVCDFAAEKIANILDWPDRPDEKWTEAQWENLRSRAKLAVQK